jgi:hypothetical protein
MKELSQNLGSAFGRLINETMIPMVTKILEIMDERGLIDLPLRINGLDVKVSPVSPLAMAQNMDEVQNIIQFMQIAQSLGPEGQMAVKMGSVADYIADKLGVPAMIRTSPEERAQMMQQMQQLAMQAQQAQAPAAGAPALEGAM